MVAACPSVLDREDTLGWGVALVLYKSAPFRESWEMRLSPTFIVTPNDFSTETASISALLCRRFRAGDSTALSRHTFPLDTSSLFLSPVACPRLKSTPWSSSDTSTSISTSSSSPSPIRTLQRLVSLAESSVFTVTGKTSGLRRLTGRPDMTTWDKK